MKREIGVLLAFLGYGLSCTQSWAGDEKPPAIGRLFAPAQAERSLAKASPGASHTGQRVDGAVARSLGPNTVWLEGQVVAPGKAGITTSQTLLPKVRLPDGRQAVVGEVLPDPQAQVLR